MAEDIRILALFGARVLFGQERANIEALATLQGEGCAVLCVIRSETWPGVLSLRAALDARGLAWVTAPYIDYPLKGWLVHIALRNPGAYLRGAALLRRLVRAFRPTHFHVFNPLYAASFFGTLRSSSIPVVYRVGEKPTVHNIFYRALWRFIAARAAHFVADSRFIQDELLALGVDAARITVLYAPPPRRIGPSPVEIPAGARGADALRFVYVGQLIPQKGVGLLLEAFRMVAAAHPRARLLIAGRISDWSGDDWARALRDQAAADPLTGGRVSFLGSVEDAPELIRRCDVHVAPSLVEEGYGLVVAEAKSVGRPSIIFRSGGMAELVEDGVDGAALADKTASALAQAMRAYAEQPQLARNQGRAALASMGKLGFGAFAGRWRRVYEGAARPSSLSGAVRP